MVVDGEGRKQSKSLGNVIDPLDVVKEYGSDVLRLWVSSLDYTSDARLSKDILKQLSEIYRKIRNTARILLGNLDDFDPSKDMLDYAELQEIDKWALSRLNELIKRTTESYEKYQYHHIYHDIHNFCTIDMSKLYVDITKDRVYVEAENSTTRRSTQTAMYKILHALTRLIAPILNFTSDEIWQSMTLLCGDDKTCVNFNDMPKYDENLKNAELEEKWDKLFFIRDDVMKALEVARANKLIGKSLDAKVIIYGDAENEYMRHLKISEIEKELNTVFIVSQTELENTEVSGDDVLQGETGLKIKICAADGKKCDRCWIYAEEYTEDDEGSVICKRCGEILNIICK